MYNAHSIVRALSLNGAFFSNLVRYLYVFQTPQFIVLWVLFILIVVGNSAVLIALLKHKGRKSRMNFFIMHLAFAGDLFSTNILLCSVSVYLPICRYAAL